MTTHVEATQLTPKEAMGARCLRFFGGAGLNILLVAISGVLASLIFPPLEAWWLVWVCLLPLLIALRRTTTVRAAGWLMLLFGIIFFAGSLSWLASIFHGSVVGIYVLATLPWILFGLAYRLAYGRGAGIILALLAPVLFLAVEWIRCEGWYFEFSWGQPGYALASCPRGGVLYPFIGVYGVTFLIVLVNALIVEIGTARVPLLRRALLFAPLVLLGGWFCYYLNAPAAIPTVDQRADHVICTGIVQNEIGNLAELKKQTLAIALAKPALVVWPEYAVEDYPLSHPSMLRELQSLARALHCTLVLGCKDHVPSTTPVNWLRRHGMMSMEGGLFHNTALVIGPDGAVIGKYYKTHPIQFFSDGVPGRSFPTFPTPVGRIGIAICYDFDYASTTLNLVHNGAELLLAPTSDSMEFPELQHVQHARMAQARAAECARWVVRATSSGISEVINPRGQVTARIDGSSAATIVSQASTATEITPYVRYMYRLPMVCLGISLLWLGWFVVSALKRRRKG